MEKQALQELGMSLYRKLRRAIEAGQNERALALLDEIDRNRVRYCNTLVGWIDMLLTTLANRVGEEAVHETHQLFDRRFVRPLFPGITEDPEKRLRTRAYVWTSSHGTDVDIEEDDEKFVLRFRCPSGGNLRASGQFGKTQKAHPWSHGQQGMGYYCTHCSTIFEFERIEEFGYPDWLSFPQEGGRCIQYLYKDPKRVPPEYYRRVGKDKSQVTG